MKLYVFNTLVIPVNFDEQEEVQIKTRRVSLEEAREIVREAKEQGALESAVGHQGSAEFLTHRSSLWLDNHNHMGFTFYLFLFLFLFYQSHHLAFSYKPFCKPLGYSFVLDL